MFKLTANSWSDLTWQQLCTMWQLKILYAGKPDIARAAAMMALLRSSLSDSHYECGYENGVKGWGANLYDNDAETGERQYLLSFSYNKKQKQFVCTARELSLLAKQVLAWFDFPYGDPGEKEQRDNKGNVVREHRAGLPGYVSNMHDAMILPKEEIKVRKSALGFACKFQLPQAACANITWEQYRALQSITPLLFADTNTIEQTTELQARFLANILIPRSLSLFDTTGGNIKIRPHYVYQYSSNQAERLEKFWQTIIKRHKIRGGVLFHICFQVYQTALGYYSEVYPILFSGGSEKGPIKDALTGEVGTINTIMKYQGYTDPQAVYDANLPIILDVLNTMTKEAKEIEKMNAKAKKRKI